MTNFFLKYYPIILAFLSFLFSVFLWFSGDKLAGIFVGIWVPSILALSISIRQRNPFSLLQGQVWTIDWLEPSDYLTQNTTSL